SRTRIAAQVLWESLILAVLGGVVGFIGAIWSVRAVRAFIPSTLPRGDEISVNGHVLAFALFAVVMAGLLFSLAPLCHASRVQLSIMLQETQHSIAGNRKQKRLAGLLAVGEIALAVILLVGAGLLMQTFWRLQQPERGFDPQTVLTFEISWPSEKYRN